MSSIREGRVRESMGKNHKMNSSTDRNKAELVGKISKINSSTGTLIQDRRVIAVVQN